MPEGDLSKIHIAHLSRFTVEIGWNAIHDTFSAEIFEDCDTETSYLVKVIGIEPASYHRLDFLIKDLNDELEELGSDDFVEIPERIFDYVQFGVPPQSLIDRLNTLFFD